MKPEKMTYAQKFGNKPLTSGVTDLKRRKVE
jgi:hypothetical protein